MQTDSLFGFGFFSNLKIAAPYSPRSNGKRRRRRRVNRKPPFPTSASYSSLPVKSPHEILRVPPVQRFRFSVWFRRSCVHSGAIVVLYRGTLLIAPCSTSCWNEGSRRSSLRFGEHTLRQRRLFFAYVFEVGRHRYPYCSGAAKGTLRANEQSVLEWCSNRPAGVLNTRNSKHDEASIS